MIFSGFFIPDNRRKATHHTSCYNIIFQIRFFPSRPKNLSLQTGTFGKHAIDRPLSAPSNQE